MIASIYLKDLIGAHTLPATVAAMLPPALVGICAKWLVFGNMTIPADNSERRELESRLVQRFLLAILGAACAAVGLSFLE